MGKDISTENHVADEQRIQTTKWRFIIILLSWLCKFLTSFQYVQYIMVPDVLIEYFDVSHYVISWTSTVMNTVFIIMVFPTIWFLERYDLRIASITASGCLLIGSILKCVVMTRSFAFTLIGQCFVGISNVFVSLMPARMAAEWFPENEVSKATGILLSAQIIGNALGVLVPPMLIRGPVETHDGHIYPIEWSDSQHENSTDATHEVHGQMFLLFLTQAVLVALVHIAVIAAFKSQPKYSPSKSWMLKKVTPSEKVSALNLDSYKLLLKNIPFVMLMISYGLAIGSSMTFVTLISQLLRPFLGDSMTPNALNKLVAQMSFTRTITGFLGSFFSGFILDKFRCFKRAYLIDYLMILLFLIGFAASVVYGGVIAQFILMGGVGLFFNTIYSFAFQLGAEITYPAPESTMTGLLSVTSHFFSFLLTQILQLQIEYFNKDDAENTKLGPYCAIATLTGVLLIGFITTAFIKEDRRRQRAASLSSNGTSITSLGSVTVK